MEVRGTLYILKDIREYGVKANLDPVNSRVSTTTPDTDGNTAPHSATDAAAVDTRRACPLS